MVLTENQHPEKNGVGLPEKWIARSGVERVVSVIVPVFNRENVILDCVNSVLLQSYRPIELIVVDDGSTDGTAEKLKNWGLNHTDEEGFSYKYLLQSNLGANVARNRGILESQGAYIQFLDSDDLLMTDKIESGVQIIEEQKVDYAYCIVEFCDQDLSVLPGTFGSPMDSNDGDFLGYHWQTMGPVYRREVIRSVGPWKEEIFYADDWEYAARIKIQKWKGVFDPVVRARLRCYTRTERKGRRARLAEAKDYFIAYRSIADYFRRIQVPSVSIQKRIGQRFLVCGLQFGACSDFEGQTRAFTESKKYWSSSVFLDVIFKVLRVIRLKAINRMALWSIRKLRGCA